MKNSRTGIKEERQRFKGHLGKFLTCLYTNARRITKEPGETERPRGNSDGIWLITPSMSFSKHLLYGTEEHEYLQTHKIVSSVLKLHTGLHHLLGVPLLWPAQYRGGKGCSGRGNWENLQDLVIKDLWVKDVLRSNLYSNDLPLGSQIPTQHCQWNHSSSYPLSPKISIFEADTLPGSLLCYEWRNQSGEFKVQPLETFTQSLHYPFLPKCQ